MPAVFFSVAILLKPASAALKGETCTVLRQYDYKLGEIVVCLGESHARVDCMNGRCTIVASAPDWKVTVFNKDKQYLSSDSKRWREFGLEGISKSRRMIFDGKLVPLSKVKFLGLNAVQVNRVLNSEPSEGFDIAFQTKKRKQPTTKLYSRISTDTASSDLKFNPKINDFVEGLYLTPPNARVFLSAVSTEQGEKRTTFGTHSIKKETFPIEYFQVPSGLKKAYSYSTVIAGREVEGVLMEVLGDERPIKK